MNSEFETIIGLEVHALLNTKSKMFCRCRNSTQLESPNTNICPVCLGMPGTLPVPNCQAIEMTVKLGLALNSNIAEHSKFDRKHYFYPDLPKGYQISQYDQPFCKGGYVMCDNIQVRLNRIHLEEDAGKLIHEGNLNISKVDLNRAGTPLVEIVTEPDIKTPEQASDFLKELQLILRRLKISLADMEKGHLRCDANINVINGGKSSPIIEIKNINSFKFLYKALLYEQKRLIKEFDTFDGKKTKMTRGFDAKKEVTYSLRDKEEAKDYRYFPEPDIPPFNIADFIDFKKLKNESSTLPSEFREVLEKANIKKNDIEIIIKDDDKLEAVSKMLNKGNDFLRVAINLIINENNFLKLSSEKRNDLINLIIKKNLSSNIIRSLIKELVESNKNINEIYQENDQDLDKIVDKVISENQDAVSKFKNGKIEVIGFLIGQIMRETAGKCNPAQARKIIMEKIKNG